MKTKVLLVYNKVWPYRIKIFELINNKVDLTVGFSDPSFLGKEYSFKTMYLPIKKMGPFQFHRNRLSKICANYDVVIGLFDVRWLSLMSLVINPFRRYAMVYWGIGVRASYENKFDSTNAWDKVRFFIAKKAEALIFYSSYPLTKYIGSGVNKEKLFIANNTTEVKNAETIDYSLKKNFLFVGTLYEQKGINILLDAYLNLSNELIDYPLLDIIGDGPEADNIRKFIDDNKLQHRIKMHGSVYDPKVLADFYQKSIACISPNQAGLSVLTTMGNATIFVTEKEAITGGEIFSITNNINGMIYEGGVEELYLKLKWIVEHKEESLQMCKEALEFYKKSRTPEQMANAISDAVVFASNSFRKRNHSKYLISNEAN